MAAHGYLFSLADRVADFPDIHESQSGYPLCLIGPTTVGTLQPNLAPVWQSRFHLSKGKPCDHRPEVYQHHEPYDLFHAKIGQKRLNMPWKGENNNKLLERLQDFLCGLDDILNFIISKFRIER